MLHDQKILDREQLNNNSINKFKIVTSTSIEYNNNNLHEHSNNNSLISKVNHSTFASKNYHHNYDENNKFITFNNYLNQSEDMISTKDKATNPNRFKDKIYKGNMSIKMPSINNNKIDDHIVGNDHSTNNVDIIKKQKVLRKKINSNVNDKHIIKRMINSINV